MDTRERLLALLSDERQAKIRQELELLSKINVSLLSDAALAELYDAVSGEITRRDIRENTV